MPDELTRATVRVQQFLRTMRGAEYANIDLLMTGNDPFPLGENPACRALAAAALAEAGWRLVSEAPETCPDRGGQVGRYLGDFWDVNIWHPGRSKGSVIFGMFTHFRINPAPPPKPETAP